MRRSKTRVVAWKKKIMNEAKDCYNILALFHSHVVKSKEVDNLHLEAI